MSAVVFGDNCIDRYLPPVDADYVGGQGVNVASHLARAGLSVAYAGVVGSDQAAAVIVRELNARGVDASLVERRQGATGLTLVDVSPAGERRFVREEYGVSAPYRPSRAAIAAASRADVVYAVHLEDVSPLRQAIPRPTLLTVDASEETPDAFLAADPDVIFMSRPQLSPAEAHGLAKDVALGRATLVVVTLGRAGAVVAASDGSAFVDAGNERIVDTLGAGDAFAAAFLVARMRGLGLMEALHDARRASAIVCAHRGGYPPVCEGEEHHCQPHGRDEQAPAKTHSTGRACE